MFNATKYLVCLKVLFLLGCAQSLPEAELINFDSKSSKVDLSSQLPGAWDQVCVITPYSTNKIAKKVLGVHANVTGNSKISTSDSIALLVTLMNGEVVQLFEAPSENVYFASPGSSCYSRDNAVFKVSVEGVTHDDNT